MELLPFAEYPAQDRKKENSKKADGLPTHGCVSQTGANAHQHTLSYTLTRTEPEWGTHIVEKTLKCSYSNADYPTRTHTHTTTVLQAQAKDLLSFVQGVRACRLLSKTFRSRQIKQILESGDKIQSVHIDIARKGHLSTTSHNSICSPSTFP